MCLFIFNFFPKKPINKKAEKKNIIGRIYWCTKQQLEIKKKILQEFYI